MYSWNFDRYEEEWDECEPTVEACLAAARNSVDDYEAETGVKPTVVYIAETRDYVPHVSAVDALDPLEEQAIDECGEVGELWESFRYEEKEQLEELEKELNKVVHIWMKKYGYYPNFGYLENIKEYTL